MGEGGGGYGALPPDMNKVKKLFFFRKLYQISNNNDYFEGLPSGYDYSPPNGYSPDKNPTFPIPVKVI